MFFVTDRIYQILALLSEVYPNIPLMVLAQIFQIQYPRINDPPSDT